MQNKHFKTHVFIHGENEYAAMHRFESFAKQKSPYMPLFKQVGMQMVLFGAREPKLYQLLFENVWIYTFGVGALCATRVCHFSEEKLGQMLSTEFQAMMLLVKSKAGEKK